MKIYKCWRTVDEVMDDSVLIEADTAEMAAIAFIRNKTDSDSEIYDVSVLGEGRLLNFDVHVHHDIRYTTKLVGGVRWQ